MAFADRVRVILRALAIRVALLCVGCAAFAAALWINMDAGNEILAGLFSPRSSTDIAVSVLRIAAPAVGLSLIYRALR